jgi:hypothetical protein
MEMKKKKTARRGDKNISPRKKAVKDRPWRECAAAEETVASAQRG